jgi:hypothetical protein
MSNPTLESEFRRQDDRLIPGLQQQLDEHIAKEKEMMKEIKEDIATIKSNLEELLDLWNNTKGFIKIMSVLGRVVKWASAVLLSIAAIYYAITGRPFK